MESLKTRVKKLESGSSLKDEDEVEWNDFSTEEQAIIRRGAESLKRCPPDPNARAMKSFIPRDWRALTEEEKQTILTGTRIIMRKRQEHLSERGKS